MITEKQFRHKYDFFITLNFTSRELSKISKICGPNFEFIYHQEEPYKVKLVVPALLI